MSFQRLALLLALLTLVLVLPQPSGRGGEPKWPGRFASRTPNGKVTAMRRYGVPARDEAAVQAALAWLARHQSKDGSWDASKYSVLKGRTRTQIACTALATLAFLGSGNSAKHGRYSAGVKKSIAWLIAQQQKSGFISASDKPSSKDYGAYHHAIATLALAEAYAMDKDKAVGEAAQKAVNATTPRLRGQKGGWAYSYNNRDDLSVSNWVAAHLATAKEAGLTVPADSFKKIDAFLKSREARGGGYIYTPFDGKMRPSMCAAAVVTMLAAGIKRTDRRVTTSAGLVYRNMPDWNLAKKKTYETFYYWRVGSEAMFSMGGAAWRQWHIKVSRTLTKNQKRGGPLDGSTKDLNGSWDPITGNDRIGGRVYTTAMGALILETCYRARPPS